MDLTGAQIKAALEQQWQPAGAARPFLRLGASEGFTYTYDPGKAAGVADHRTMWLDGTPIDLAATYSVTVNSFLAAGGDNFSAFAGGTGKQDTGKTDLQAHGRLHGRVRRLPTPLPVDYSQRAVSVVFPPGAPASYAPGGSVGVRPVVARHDGTGDTKDASVAVSLDGDGAGDLPGRPHGSRTEIFDESGKASVSVTLPAQDTGRAAGAGR